MYNLDDDHTYKTLNERPGKYKGTPGAATINLGSEKEPGVIDIDADEDNMSRVSATTGVSKDDLMVLSKDDLIQMLIKKGNISERVGERVPHPQVLISRAVRRQMMRGVRPVTTLILPLAQVMELGLVTAWQLVDSQHQLPLGTDGRP